MVLYTACLAQRGGGWWVTLDPVDSKKRVSDARGRVAVGKPLGIGGCSDSSVVYRYYEITLYDMIFMIVFIVI